MKVLVALALLVCGAFAEGPQCEAPNGGGLTPVLAEFADMIPVEKVLEVLLTAMTSDPETQVVMEYLSSPDFHQIVTLVQSQPSFKTLMHFACTDLFVDAAYYFNMLSGIFGFPEVRAYHSVNYRTAGFNGMLHDILELIPIEQMQALFEQKLASDHYVQMAFQKINSDEFGTLIETLQTNAAYNDMKDRLRGYGVDVEMFIDTISKIFRP